MNGTGFVNIGLFIILGVIIVFLFLMAQLSVRILSRYVSWKRNILFAGVYLAILILLVPLSYLLPRQEFTQAETNKNEMNLSSPEDVVTLFSSEDNPDQIKGIYKNKSQTFTAHVNSLSFDSSVNRGNNLVFIKRKAVDDGEVEMSSYTNELLVGGINYTKFILPPNVLLDDGYLSIKEPSHQSFEYKQFMADFTIDQFKHLNSKSLDSYSNQDWNIIYLYVPQSMEIHNYYKNVHVLE
ncbi:hypothetical protein ACHOLT_17980 [Desulfitobacterium sp. Sab5]|uniref:hypothetical protein n=1 Tax=Desulfitobacterium nosdiversum TaxID=3375356 RepID=UPI003CF66C47